MAIIIYLINRFIYRLAEFFRHWYINSFKIYSHFIVSFLERLDRGIALRITWQHLFEPLYQDRTFIGYALGIPFRIIRLIIGITIYAVVISIAVFFYLIWLVVPVYIFYKIISPILIRK